MPLGLGEGFDSFSYGSTIHDRVQQFPPFPALHSSCERTIDPIFQHRLPSSNILQHSPSKTSSSSSSSSSSFFALRYSPHQLLSQAMVRTPLPRVTRNQEATLTTLPCRKSNPPPPTPQYSTTAEHLLAAKIKKSKRRVIAGQSSSKAAASHHDFFTQTRKGNPPPLPSCSPTGPGGPCRVDVRTLTVAPRDEYLYV